MKTSNGNILMPKNHALTYIFSSQLNAHESDFHREHEEKLQFQNTVESLQQESKRLKLENQSHMATIRRFESDVRNTYYLLCFLDALRVKCTTNIALQQSCLNVVLLCETELCCVL